MVNKEGVSMDFQSAARFGTRRVMVTDYDETAVKVNAKVVDEDTGEVICESGGGGSSDISTVKVTLISNVSEALPESDVIGFGGQSHDSEDVITALYKENGAYYYTYDFDVTTPERSIDIYKFGESFNIFSIHPMTATGNATVEVQHPAPTTTYYMATVTGDCTLTIADSNG